MGRRRNEEKEEESTKGKREKKMEENEEKKEEKMGIWDKKERRWIKEGGNGEKEAREGDEECE